MLFKMFLFYIVYIVLRVVATLKVESILKRVAGDPLKALI